MNSTRFHVAPVEDLREHIIDDDQQCWCNPVEDDNGVIVHNSMDGREAFEQGKRKLS